VFPEFRTAQLRLTLITLADAESVFEMFSDPAVVEFYDLDPFKNLGEAEDLIRLFESRYQAKSGIRWGIRAAESGELIGSCGFNSWSEKMRNGTIGYDLKRRHWGKGLATEALAEVVRAAFAGLLPCGALHRIQADTVVGNVASERVLAKLGFQEEGVRRGSAYLRGCYRDMKCFGLINSVGSET
jgi:ribosomal-protein-alanine N-acetyltransferase